jgi:hypothetical protein
LCASKWWLQDDSEEFLAAAGANVQHTFTASHTITHSLHNTFA